MVKDPVCGIEVDEKTAPYKTVYAHNVYYFNTTECQRKFNEKPEKYAQLIGPKHASHYGAYCPSPGCAKPARGIAWYLYIGLIVLVLSAVLLTLLFAR